MKGLWQSFAVIPSVISDKAVIKVRDYLTGKAKLPSGELEALPLVGSDVLYFELEGGSRLVVRPSGTEPKIKVYILVRGETAAESAQLIEGFEELCAQPCKGLTGYILSCIIT